MKQKKLSRFFKRYTAAAAYIYAKRACKSMNNLKLKKKKSFKIGLTLAIYISLFPNLTNFSSGQFWIWRYDQ